MNHNTCSDYTVAYRVYVRIMRNQPPPTVQWSGDYIINNTDRAKRIDYISGRFDSSTAPLFTINLSRTYRRVNQTRPTRFSARQSFRSDNERIRQNVFLSRVRNSVIESITANGGNTVGESGFQSVVQYFYQYSTYFLVRSVCVLNTEILIPLRSPTMEKQTWFLYIKGGGSVRQKFQ